MRRASGPVLMLRAELVRDNRVKVNFTQVATKGMVLQAERLHLFSLNVISLLQNSHMTRPTYRHYQSTRSFTDTESSRLLDFFMHQLNADSRVRTYIYISPSHTTIIFDMFTVFMI